MDIQQTIAPAAPKAQALDKNATSQLEQDTDGTSPMFAQLLQGAKKQSASDAEEAASTTDIDFKEVATESTVVDIAGLATSVDAAINPALVDANPDTFNFDSLVGQTQRLDSWNLDADVQDGSLWQQCKEVGLLPNQMQANWGAQAAIPVGQYVPTVAAGVQPLQQLPMCNADAQPGLATAMAVLSETTGVPESLVQTMADAVKADASAEMEGRMVLQGAWKLEDQALASNPHMQKLVGQVEQWAAAALGVQSNKPNERAEASKQAVNGLQWLATEHASGTRLTEDAVQETQQAQDALLDAGPEETVEDMRFWLQGKLQRAEVTMDKDGQPVRVQVSLRGSSANVTFHSDQAQTREMLDASLEQLRSMLQEQGLELGGVSVQAQTQGGAQQQNQAERSAWDTAPRLNAQISVPVDLSVPKSPATSAQRLSLYA